VPLYHLVLKTTEKVCPDPDGAEWPNDTAAHEEAILVARDLMKHQERNTRSWRVEVRDENLHFRSEVLFAEADPSLLELRPASRGYYVTAARQIASCSDAINNLRSTLAGVQETLSRAKRLIAEIAGK